MPKRRKVGSEEDRAGFVARLNEAIRSFGSANGLANAAGVSEGALRKWATGTSEPTRDRLVAIARAAAVNVAWLATGNGPKERSGKGETPLLDGFITLQQIGPREKSQKDEKVTMGLAFSTDWLEDRSEPTGENLATAQVPDDSMAPLLPAGCVLVLDQSSSGIPRDGIYAMILDGTLLVRRLQKMPGGQIEASAEIASYQSFRFHPSDSEVTILGRAIWAGRDL